MSRKLFINVTPAEVRAAWTEESVLIDLMVDRGERASVIGNIYLGRVERVMRGMEAAFVNVGFQRSGFLGLDGGRRRNGNTGPPVHEGEAVVVQVTKDAIASKGVQLTRRVTLPGRFLVYAPFQDRVMISRKIEVVNERERLAGLMAKLALDGEGFVVRTASVGASKKELETDCNQLREAWAAIEKAEINGSAPSCLHAEIDPVLRVLRDHVQSDIDIIYVDNAAAAEAAQKFCEKNMPGIAHKVQLYTGEKQMFEQYGIEEEIEHAFTSRVGLRSGGSLVIQTTEALTSFDVNSGSFDGVHGMEEIALRTNREAVEEAARQIRLRNISGLIVIDLIQMEVDGNWDEIVCLMEGLVCRDRNPTSVLGVTKAGLLEVIRRRRHEPLINAMTEICVSCQGTGRRKSADAVSVEILRALQFEARNSAPGEIVLHAADEIVNFIENHFGALVNDIEDFTGRTIKLRSNYEYKRENYDIFVG